MTQRACLHAGDRDGVVKYWDLRKALEPVTVAVLPQHASGQNYLLPAVSARDAPFFLRAPGHA